MDIKKIDAIKVNNGNTTFYVNRGEEVKVAYEYEIDGDIVRGEEIGRLDKIGYNYLELRIKSISGDYYDTYMEIDFKIIKNITIICIKELKDGEDD